MKYLFETQMFVFNFQDLGFETSLNVSYFLRSV